MYEILHKTIRDFPKLEKYSLGITIEKTMLECIEYAFAATAAPTSVQKAQAVATVSAKFDALKVYLRLALRADCLDEKKYVQLIPPLGSIGIKIGGWVKEAKKFLNPIPNPKPIPPEPSDPKS